MENCPREEEEEKEEKDDFKLCTCQQKSCLLGGIRIGRVRREGKGVGGEH
jgi:hypothetical protein